MSLTMITVTGDFTDAGSAAQSGSVLFTPTVPLADASGKVIVTATTVTAAVTGGTFSQSLITTDNAGIVPPGWAYNVQVVVAGAQQSFQCLLPSSLGTSVDVSALAPVNDTSPSGNYFVSSVNGQTGALTVLGGVSVTNVPSGAGKVLTSTSGTTAQWQ